MGPRASDSEAARLLARIAAALEKRGGPAELAQTVGRIAGSRDLKRLETLSEPAKRELLAVLESTPEDLRAAEPAAVVRLVNRILRPEASAGGSAPHPPAR